VDETRNLWMLKQAISAVCWSERLNSFPFLKPSPFFFHSPPTQPVPHSLISVNSCSFRFLNSYIYKCESLLTLFLPAFTCKFFFCSFSNWIILSLSTSRIFSLVHIASFSFIIYSSLFFPFTSHNIYKLWNLCRL